MRRLRLDHRVSFLHRPEPNLTFCAMYRRTLSMQISMEVNLNALSALEDVIYDTHKFLLRYGIHKSPTISLKNRDIFLSWTAEYLNKITANARKVLEAHLVAERSGLDFDDSTHLLKVALKVLGFSVDPVFYKMIDRNDILEVYDSDHVQVFRSFNFFRVCNYNLDDVLAYQWFDLYERDPSVTENLLECVRTHLNGSAHISTLPATEHLLKERFSEAQAAFIVKMKKVATIYSGPERKPAYACTGEAWPVVSEGTQIDFLNQCSSHQPKPC